MIHLSSFEAVHYRGLDGLSIPRLSAANLVTGANGVGKTALLEALWLFMGRHSRKCFIEGTKYHLDASGSYLQYYSEIVRDAGKDELRSALNVILPNVSDIEILMDEAQTSYLSAVTADGRQLPLDDLGGGVVRLFRLMLSCYMSRNGILLADEIENGIHHSTLTEIWRRIRRWMTEWNVQVVATTHSNECIEAAMAAFEDAPHDLSIHKLFLNRETAGVEAATFNGKTIEGARDLNLEVR